MIFILSESQIPKMVAYNWFDKTLKDVNIIEKSGKFFFATPSLGIIMILNPESKTLYISKDRVWKKLTYDLDQEPIFAKMIIKAVLNDILKLNLSRDIEVKPLNQLEV